MEMPLLVTCARRLVPITKVMKTTYQPDFCLIFFILEETPQY
jgi:hypothetical protein